MCIKGSVSQDFRPQFISWFKPIWAPDKQVKYFRIVFRFRRDIRSQSLKNSTLQCAWHHVVKILGLENQNIFLQIFSFLIDVFTPKRISPDCPFKSNQRPATFSIQTTRCAVWLHGGMHTAKLDSVVWCKLQSLARRCDTHYRVFWEIWVTLLITLWCDAHRRAWLCRTVWCTLQKSDYCTSKMSVFVFSNSFTFFNYVL